MIVCLLFERMAPSGYVRVIHSPEHQQRRQQRSTDSDLPRSKRVHRISQVDEWEADEKDDDVDVVDGDEIGGSAVEFDDDDGEEWAKVHAMHCERLAKQNNKLAKQLLDKHLRGSPLSDVTLYRRIDSY